MLPLGCGGTGLAGTPRFLTTGDIPPERCHCQCMYCLWLDPISFSCFQISTYYYNRSCSRGLDCFICHSQTLIKKVSKPTECTTLRLNRNINYGLWLIMMSQCRFIDLLKKECPNLKKFFFRVYLSQTFGPGLRTRSQEFQKVLWRLAVL